MPRVAKPVRHRPLTLKELDESLSAWNPTLERYNARCREFDTEEEKALIKLGRDTYPERLVARRKELREADTAALPLCPITSQRPRGKVSGFTLERAIRHIPNLGRIVCEVLCALASFLWPEKNKLEVWPSVATIAARAHCSPSSVQACLSKIEKRQYITVKQGGDRKGDSRLRPDKPRSGGRKRTTHWDINVNGIFLLAYAPRPLSEDEPCPFEPEEKGPPATGNTPPITQKGPPAGPEQT
jgi:hypothetical protein